HWPRSPKICEPFSRSPSPGNHVAGQRFVYSNPETEASQHFPHRDAPWPEAANLQEETPMMFLYLFLLLLLLLARVFVNRRVARLEKKYERASRAARDLLAQPLFKGGNNNRLDPTAHAKQQ